MLLTVIISVANFYLYKFFNNEKALILNKKYIPIVFKFKKNSVIPEERLSKRKNFLSEDVNPL